MPAIAITGMACRYPGASNPVELWENVLAQRQAFRRLPAERLRKDDYYSANPAEPDRTYSAMAAVIEGFDFDRVQFNVSGAAFRAADMTHWLSLDVAAQALADARFVNGDLLPRETAGVFVGNTLAGEFSRANVMRLRWPYVRRVLESSLAENGWSPEQRGEFVSGMEAKYKSSFPDVGEDTLAGGMSNTIAGRISNYFDLQGGCYALDGACASSLLAISHACAALCAGDVDVAIAGGVDLSLDPFELVGFAKAGALAKDKMRVYDALSSGFWPGEGCGFVVLMRENDALALRKPVYALVRGWGISSDGNGGLTRPEVEGQLLALKRAYHRAQMDPGEVSLYEGHGTGTAVGDATELGALCRIREESKSGPRAAAISSIKANIGHTKAAAGIAGFIKAAKALETQIIPPVTGCENPHPLLAANADKLRIAQTAEPWIDGPLFAGVSAMGFGGINVHAVLQGVQADRKAHLTPREKTLSSSWQDCELFLFEGDTAAQLLELVDRVLSFTDKLAYFELTDLAAALARSIVGRSYRAAVVASNPDELFEQLQQLRNRIKADHVSDNPARPRVGFLFSGQGVPATADGGAWARRFSYIRDLYSTAALPVNVDPRATEFAQPAISTASLAALRVMDRIGIEAAVAVGHSLGELSALRWAGAIDDITAIRIAQTRGRAMAEVLGPPGVMAGITASASEIHHLIGGHAAVIAGLNTPRQTVISGEANAVREIIGLARRRGWDAKELPVSHAFHSSLVAPAVSILERSFARERFLPLARPIISTVTGEPLDRKANLRDHLLRQITAPVHFFEAISASEGTVDCWVELGPGNVLGHLVKDCGGAPVWSVDAGGHSLKALFQAIGSLFVLGAPVKPSEMFNDRFTRPFNLDWQPVFFSNPCERAPAISASLPIPTERNVTVPPPSRFEGKRPLDVVRALVAERAELPLSSIQPHSRMLSDLHLNSIVVSQIVSETCSRLGVSTPAAPLEFADASILQVAETVEELMRLGASPPAIAADRIPAGIDTWIRCFTVDLKRKNLAARAVPHATGEWQILGAADHPLCASLRKQFATTPGRGIVLCVPEQPQAVDIPLLLSATRDAAKMEAGTNFILVQNRGGAAALAKTLQVEAPSINVCLVDVPFESPDAAMRVAEEALHASRYTEAVYDRDGVRWEPALKLLDEESTSPEFCMSDRDVVLVTGGGKGIAAECALDLARNTGVRLILLGRSTPESDTELLANLNRFQRLGVSFRYVTADLTSLAQVRFALAQAEHELGPITGIVHGAGVNVPTLITELTPAAFNATVATKVDGLRNVLSCVRAEGLRLLVAFGSLIARTGLTGEADYAVANEWLRMLVDRWQREHRDCYCLTIEWSVWSGAGMGQRLGRIDALAAQGISAISTDEGLAMFRHLISRRIPVSSVVVTGRFGDPPTLKNDNPELPLRRFLERPLYFVRGVELIVDVEIARETDPYIEDHVFDRMPILPAVMALEAMAQVATALLESCEPPTFESVAFERAISVKDVPVVIRIAALIRAPGACEITIRSSETAFQVDHVRATCLQVPVQATPIPRASDYTPASLIPEDLYGNLLFHGPRFRRLKSYRHLRAAECVTEIDCSHEDWFGAFLPQTLLLGDPGARDAAVHGIQACIPQSTLLPVSVDRIFSGSMKGFTRVQACARETRQEGDCFIYDMDIASPDGVIIERWEGLRLKRIRETGARRTWVEGLLGPYIERRLREFLLGDELPAVTVRLAAARDRQTTRRPDGKRDGSVSASHGAGISVEIAGADPLGCDVEPVVPRSVVLWRDLLGSDRFQLAEFLRTEAKEDLDTAATRVWTAYECLKKAGTAPDAPLLFAKRHDSDCVALISGTMTIMTLLEQVRSSTAPLVIAVLVSHTRHPVQIAHASL